MVKSSTGGYENLWNLCSENDRISYLKYFVIPILEDFKERVSDKDPINQLRKFYQISGLADSVGVDKNGFVKFTAGITYLSAFSIYFAVFQYLGVGDLFDFLLSRLLRKEQNIELLVSIREFILNNRKRLEQRAEPNDHGDVMDLEINLKEYFDELNESILLKTQVYNQLDSFMKSVNSKLKEFKDEINSESQMTNSLIDLQ